MNMYQEVGRALRKTEYTILHGWQSLPDYHKSDLDIAINPQHLKMLEMSLLDFESARLVQVLQHEYTCFHFILAAKNGDGMKYLQIDASTDYRRNGLIYFSSEQLNRARKKWKGFWISSPEMELAYLLVKKTLKGETPEHQKKRLELLIEELGEKSSIAISTELFGNVFGPRVIFWICKENWSVLESNVSKLKNALMMETVRKDPLNPFKYWINEANRILRRWLNPTGLFITVLGPDGVGKSTLIKRLEHELSVAFRRTESFHLRPGVLGKKPEGRPVTDPHGKPARSYLLSTLKILYYFADYTLGYLFKIYPKIIRSTMVISDRYCDDLLVDPDRYRYGGSFWLVKLICYFIPRPTLYLVLDIPVDKILKRKQEVGEKELIRQRKAYMNLAARLPNAFILDSGGTPEKVADDASEIITNYLHNRYVERGGSFFPNNDKLNTLAWLTSVLSADPRGSFFTIKGAGNRDKSLVWETTYEFKYLPVKDGRAYLLPLKRKPAENGLLLYNAQSEKAKVLKALLKKRYIIGLSSLLLNSVSVMTSRGLNVHEKSEVLIFEYLKELMNLGELDFALSLGTPGPHRKPVIQINNREGIVIGYVKVGWNEVTNSLVRNEADTIKKLSGTSFGSFGMPSVLHAGWWHDRYFTVLSSPESHLLPASKTLNSMYMNVINDLADFNSRSMLVRESDFWAVLLNRVNKVKNGYFRSVLKQKGILRIEKVLNNISLPFHMSHGDFAPWNSYAGNGKIFLYDWEYARPYTPAGYDLFHYIFQTNVFLEKRNSDELHTSVLSDSLNGLTKKYWEKLGISRDSLNTLFLLYLLDRFSFAASEGSGSFQELNRFSKIIMLLTDI